MSDPRVPVLGDLLESEFGWAVEAGWEAAAASMLRKMDAATLPEPSSLSAEDTALVAEVERVLRENGLSDNPGQFDSNIHSWRCEYPDRYGPCTCFQELRDDLAQIVDRALADERRRAGEREAALRAEAWDESARFIIQQAEVTSPEYALERADRFNRFNPYRAALAADEPTPPSHDESPETGAREVTP